MKHHVENWLLTIIRVAVKHDARGLPGLGETPPECQNSGNASHSASSKDACGFERILEVEKLMPKYPASTKHATHSGKGDASLQLSNIPSLHSMRTSASPVRLV